MARIRDTFRRVPSGWRVTDPLTSVMFEANSYINLRGKIITHRRNNGIEDLDVDGFIHEQICARNPEEFCQQWPKQTKPVSIRYASNLWAALHRRALAHQGGDDWGWFNVWMDQIPRQGCSCRANWKAWIIKNPPDWEHYFEWTVRAHNDVNARIGKPIVTIEQARRIWSAPAA